MRLFALFSLVWCSLCADPQSLAVTEGEPSALIEGCVSAITGDLYLSTEDVVVQGYIPLRLPRYYLSGDAKEKTWFFFNHLRAVYKVEKPHHTITVSEMTGSTFTFQADSERVVKEHHKYDSKKRKKKKKKKDGTPKHSVKFRPLTGEMIGATNTSQAEMGGHTNLKNALVYLEADGTHLTFHCPDGTVRSYKIHHQKRHFKTVFKKNEEGKLRFLLESETLPTGHQVMYTYDHEDRVSLIRTTSPGGGKTYASARFHYHHQHREKSPDVDIELSDGRMLQYRYTDKHGKFVLTHVQSPQAPEQVFFYHSKARRGGCLLSRFAQPGDRFCDVDYYTINHHKGDGFDIKIKSQDDPRFLRVKSIKAPVGSEGQGHLTSRIFYYPEARYTDVRDIDNTLTRYHYSEAMRLYLIERFGYGDVLIHREVFEWSSTGDLLSKALQDPQHNAFFRTEYKYDDRGNVLEETLVGDLSGEGRIETYTIRRSYNERDLILKEEYQNGKAIHYSYVPGVALIASELTYSEGRIFSRVFKTYNDNHVLVKEIRDDGNTADPNNLTGVTVRSIKAITPMPGGPFVDMPYIIEDKFWDGAQEVLLKKQVLTYTTGGNIAREEVYDANGQYRYTLHASYDHLGRVSQKTDALGQLETYAYDESGNLIEINRARTRTVMSYDFMNRLVQSKEIGDDGIERTTRHAYNGKNVKIAVTDSYGNTKHYVPDPHGRIVETHLPPVADVSGNLSPVLRSSYDGAGREISRTTALG